MKTRVSYPIQVFHSITLLETTRSRLKTVLQLSDHWAQD